MGDLLPVPAPALLQALLAARELAVIPHILPDVDALGSAEGLCRILRATGRRAAVHAPGVPAIYQWALAEEVRATGEPSAGALRVGIDTARPERLLVPGPVAVVIDHHEDNPGFGLQANWVVPAPSCTCLLLPLAAALDVPVAGALATALYRGLVGDTEGFSVGLTPVAFRYAAMLAAAGADCVGTAESYRQRSAGFWRYLAEAEAAARNVPGTGDVLRVVPIPRDQPERFNLLPYENALLPGHLAAPPGGVLAILQEGANGVRFRLRSREVDVLPLAHALGGGGHPQAAGVHLAGATLAEAEEALRAAWRARALHRPPASPG